jgi:ubiquitin-activating enzyme E1
LFGRVFCDFGATFEVADLDGEQPKTGILGIVSQEAKGVVSTHDQTRHGLETGDFVTFAEVEGMTELNALPPTEITSVSPFSFSIGDTSKFAEYSQGGR